MCQDTYIHHSVILSSADTHTHVHSHNTAISSDHINVMGLFSTAHLMISYGTQACHGTGVGNH